MVPAVAGFKKQGANNGACLAFLISAPETGADSIALTYSLLGPVMTVLRPMSAMVTALVAGLIENLSRKEVGLESAPEPDLTCPVDGCCDGSDCDPEQHARHHGLFEKFQAGMRFAFRELMDDLAGLFTLGIILAGIITALVPDDLSALGWGSGLPAYLGMLAVSLPLYVCATLSTPVADALVLKGLSPGAAMVLLLAGPATNVATITMVGGLLGKRTLAVYLSSIVLCTLAIAFFTDFIYSALGVSLTAATVTSSSELFPEWIQVGAAFALGLLILRSLWGKMRARLLRPAAEPSPFGAEACSEAGCHCRDHGKNSRP